MVNKECGRTYALRAGFQTWRRANSCVRIAELRWDYSSQIRKTLMEAGRGVVPEDAATAGGSKEEQGGRVDAVQRHSQGGPQAQGLAQG